MEKKLSKEELEWQAESDAYSLVKVAEIQGDPERLKKAEVYVERIKKEAEEKLKAAEKQLENFGRLVRNSKL